ncbi:MAG TPA: hypothetical protein VL461_06105 [Dictyobacter sp.]|jgi:hypothetical protein|nr:hypothetical protein [Dictyobacter sp.]
MAIIVAVLLGLFALCYVLYPLFRTQKKEAGQVSDQLALATTSYGQMSEEEMAARNAIQEVELDYQLGNIVPSDYQELRERYMRRAVSALRSRYEREQEIDNEIEEQLQTLKESYEKADH